MEEISSFVKYHRKKLRLTQEELANKAGVGIKFIRELESGKQTVQLNKVNQVLSLFGYSVSPQKQHIDPYYIFWNLFNIAVKITLYDKTTKYGILIEEVSNENGIYEWKFIPNNKAYKYMKTKDDNLIETISHSDIQIIEKQ